MNDFYYNDDLGNVKMNFKYFYQVYHENKSKIHMTEADGVGQHPINKEDSETLDGTNRSFRE